MMELEHRMFPALIVYVRVVYVCVAYVYGRSTSLKSLLDLIGEGHFPMCFPELDARI